MKIKIRYIKNINFSKFNLIRYIPGQSSEIIIFKIKIKNLNFTQYKGKRGENRFCVSNDITT